MARAGWNTPPPATALLNTNYTVSYSAVPTPGYGLSIAKQSPSGTWTTIGGGGGAPGAMVTATGTLNCNVAGTWKVRVTDTGSGATLTTSTVNAVIPVTFNFSGGSGLAYSGSAQSVTATTTPSGGTFTKTGTWTATNAGSYTATATANGNYTGSGTYNWSIAKANQSPVAVSASASQAAFSTQTLSTTGGTGAGAVTYALTNISPAGVATLSGADLTSHGTGSVDVTATKAADTNHYSKTSSVFHITFTPVSTTFNFAGGPFTYDGGSKSVTVTPNPSNATYGQSGTWTATNAGTYTATATANGNYSGAGSCNWTIAMANQATLSIVANSVLALNSSQTLATSGGSGSGPVTYAIIDASPAGAATLNGAVLTAGNSIGWVMVQATKAADINYNATTSSLLKIWCGQTPVSFTISNTAFLFDGSAHTVSIGANPVGATFGLNGPLSATAAGLYTVTVTATGGYTGSATFHWSIVASSATDSDSDGVPDLMEQQLGTDVGSAPADSTSLGLKILTPQ